MTRIKQQIPTAAELETRAQQVLDEMDVGEREAWLNNKCTVVVFLLLEVARMQAIEAYEDGAVGDQLTQLMAQAQLAHNFTDDLQKYIVANPEKADAYQH